MRTSASLCIIAISLTAFIATAKTNTLRGKVATSATITELRRTCDADTTLYADKIVLSGYDKTLSDANESFFVTNNTPFHLSRLSLKFSYTYTETAEMLHEEIYEVDCDIPAGETRQVLIRSFDRQHKFYYYASRKPRRAATPYDITYSLLSYDVKVIVR